MKIIDVEQGSGAWHAARSGRVTASRLGDVLSFYVSGANKGKETATRAKYKAELVAETLSGMVGDHYVSQWMERGTAQEPFARAAYEARYSVMVDTVGFVVHPAIERAGCSPDGLMPHRGVEFKVPKIETHIGYIRDGILPKDYEPQVMWNLACCPEIPVWDFVSFCPELPPRHQLFCVPVERDNCRIAEMEAGVIQFLSEVDALIAELNARNPEIAEQPNAVAHPEDYLSDEELARYI